MKLFKINFHNITYLFITIILLLNILRYIFCFNNSSISPNYSDTPLWFYLLKYILLLSFFLYLIFFCSFKINLNILFVILFLLGFFFLFINIANLILYSSISQDIKVIISFILFFLPVYILNNQKIIELELIIYKVFDFVVYILIILNIVAIINLYFFGRLVAMAYGKGFVRFGSFWDDPNGFGIFMTYLFYVYLNKKNFFLALLIFLNIIPTISFSTYITLYVFMFLLALKNKKFWKLFIIINTILIMSFLFYYENLIFIYNAKSGSIEGHKFPVFVNIIPLLDGPIVISESWLITMFLSYFPFSILLIILILIFFIKFMKVDNINYNLLYLLIFLFGNLFIPYIYTFPLDFLFFILLAIELRKYNIRGVSNKDNLKIISYKNYIK